jgi:hypothetical protein
MATRIVKDSLDGMAIQQVLVGDSSKSFAQMAALEDTLVIVGAKHGLVGDLPRQGEDGNWYATVDSRALVRLPSVAGAWTDGSPVYGKASDGSVAAAAGTGLSLIGYVDRPKTATAAGDLWVQLVQTAGA